MSAPGPGPGPLALTTTDGLALEAELVPVPAPRIGVVLCHPHPQHGGTMRSVVTGALHQALPGRGITCLRFNFRGVGTSEGSFAGGSGERLDAEAAVRALAAHLGPDVPLALAGWSFGGDVALSVVDPRLAGWVAVAPPLRFADSLRAAADPRPKHLVLAQRDEFRAPTTVQAEVAAWPATHVTVVAGASHFFWGRTDRVVDLVADALDELSGTRSGGLGAAPDDAGAGRDASEV